MDSILRKFLYLDTLAVEDYFSSIVGYTFDEESIKTKSVNNFEGSASAEFSVIKGGIGKKNEKEIESEKIARINDAAKFQHIYKALNDHKELEYYETMDKKTWLENIKRNKILELGVSFRFSKLKEFSDLAKVANEFGSLIESLGEDAFDKQTQKGIQGIQMLSNIENEKGLPCVMTLIGNDDYKFIGHLNEKFLKSEIKNSSEVTVFGKVLRLIPENEKYELVDILPNFKNIAVNRKQRKQLGNKKIETPNELKDAIKGPAALLSIIAIYN